MATTLGSAHGEERKCASCGLTYRYPRMQNFSCHGCGVEQPWDGWLGKNTRIGSDDRAGTISGPEAPALPTTYELIRESDLGASPSVTAVPAIDLHAVHATLNQMSADGLRQLHDRLAILQMVAVANEAGDPEYYARVRQALAGAGVRFGA